jgi:hypothetical protein
LDELEERLAGMAQAPRAGPAANLDIPRASTTTAQVKPNSQGNPGPIGNTTGIIVPDTAPNPNGNSAPPIKATPKEEGWWKRWGSGVVHGVLDVAGFVPILGAAAGVIGAGIYVAEGDYVSAALDLASAVPIGGAAAKAGKLAMKAGEKAVLSAEKQAAKKLAEMEAKKLAELEAKKLAEKEAKELAEKEAKAAKGGKDKKAKLKCGEYGKFGELKKKTGDNKFDRDHIPSKEALKQRAAEIKGDKLTPKEAAAIDKAGEAIAIPKQAHIDASPTYGQTKAAAAKDAKNLAESARRDVEAMLKEIDKYDADGNCKKAYQKAAAKIMRMNNKDFDKMLADILKGVKK